METSQKDFKKALAVSDSLFNISQTPLVTDKESYDFLLLYINKLMILKDHVDYALKAEKIIEQTSDASWNTQVLGFFPLKYRLFGLVQ